jgi:hypothetical protein
MPRIELLTIGTSMSNSGGRHAQLRTTRQTVQRRGLSDGKGLQGLSPASTRLRFANMVAECGRDRTGSSSDPVHQLPMAARPKAGLTKPGQVDPSVMQGGPKPLPFGLRMQSGLNWPPGPVRSGLATQACLPGLGRSGRAERSGQSTKPRDWGECTDCMAGRVGYYRWTTASETVHPPCKA